MTSNLIYNYSERLSGLLRVDSRQAGLELGLQPVQLEALHYLSICNQFSDTPMTVTEYLGQTKGTVSQTLKVLEKKELISKQPDATDKRVAHLKLTEKGRQIVNQLVPTPMFNSVCLQLSDAQQAQIEAALKLLLGHYLHSNKLKSFGVCGSCQHNEKIDEKKLLLSVVAVAPVH